MASIQKRGDYWQVRISYKDTNNKFRTKSKNGFKTKKEATIYVENFTFEEPAIEKKFYNYFENWYYTYKENSVRNRTREGYIQTVNNLKKYIPNLKVSDMNRKSYQEFINDFGKTHSKKSVSKLNTAIHSCVKDAIYDGDIEKDFVAGTNLVFDPERTLKVDYLNKSEMKSLITYLMETRNVRYTSKYMIIFALQTGMRPGEIGGLKWENINSNFNTIEVKQSWAEYSKTFSRLKNESSYRIIRVAPWVIELINELPKTDPLNRVFANQLGTIPTSTAVNKVIRKSLEALNIKRDGFHFHSCRHTHVAFLLSKGVPLYAISKRLGHSNMSTTSNVYAYLIDEYKAKTDDQIIDSLKELNPFYTDKYSISKNRNAK